MSKLQNMRGVEIQKFYAISSEPKTLKELFGENLIEVTILKSQHIINS